MNHSGSNFRKTEKPGYKEKEVFEGAKGLKHTGVKIKNTKRALFETVDEEEDDYFKQKYKRESAMDYMDDEV